jgi:hypothetical protein
MLKKDAGRVCQKSGLWVMAGLRNLIIVLCSFSGKARPVAANRHDMGHPETLVELASTSIGEGIGSGPRPFAVLENGMLG